jgi:Na+/H+ antiporter NhaA
VRSGKASDFCVRSMILATWIAVNARIGTFPPDVTPMAFLGATLLCGIGDPLSFLMAEQAFPGSAYAAVAQIAVLSGSAAALVLGALVLALSSRRTLLWLRREAGPLD